MSRPGRSTVLGAALLSTAALVGSALVTTAPASASPTSRSADPERVQRLLLDRHVRVDAGTSHTVRRGGTTALAPSGQALVTAATTSATAATTSATACYQVQVSGTADRVLVTWGEPVGLASPVSSFRLQRGDGFSWRSIATLGPSARSYLDRAVPQSGLWGRYQLIATLQDGSTTPAGCWQGAGMGTDLVAVGGVNDPSVPPSSLVQSGIAPSFSEVPLARGGEMYDAAYSPDGRRVVYAWAADATSPVSLWVRPANGTGTGVQLNADPGVFFEPDWSPDGTSVVATEQVSDTETHLVRVDVRTRAVTDIPGSANLSHPTWLRNGVDLVATDLSSDTAPLVRLRTTTGARAAIPGTESGADPDASPDGTQLLFTTWSGVDTDPTYLKRVAVAGGTPATVSQSAATGDLWGPRWEPDASHVLWLDEQGLWRASPTGQDLGYLGSGRSTDTRLLYSIDLRRPVSAGTSDFTGDGRNDVLARDSTGTLWLYPTRDISAPFYPRRKVGTGWQGFTSVVAPGDLNGDGKADVLARDSTGTLWLYPGNGAVTSSSSWRPRLKAGSGWNGMTALLTPGDWDGDGLADVLARNRYGDLLLYSGNGIGGVRAGRKVGAGWNGMTALVGAGDLGIDGRSDLVARDSSGVLWLYPGNGTGGFLARRKFGTGWNTMTALVGIESFGSQTDIVLLARDTSGRLWYYYTLTGLRLESNRYQVGSGWNGFSVIAG